MNLPSVGGMVAASRAAASSLADPSSLLDEGLSRLKAALGIAQATRLLQLETALP